MNQTNCAQLHGLYKHLDELWDRFDQVDWDTIQQGQIADLEFDKLNAKLVIQEIEQILNPDVYQVELRDHIAKRHGFSYVSTFTDAGIALALIKNLKNQYAIVNEDGHVLATKHIKSLDEKTATFEEIKNVQLSDNMFLLRCIKDDPYGDEPDYISVFLDEYGEKIGEAYDHADAFSEGKAIVQDVSGHWILDKSGSKKRISSEYQPGGHGLPQFHNQRLLVSRKNMIDSHSYMDPEGNLVTNVRGFENAMEFSDGVAAVKHDPDSRWYYVDANGDDLFPEDLGYVFDTVTSFSEGVAAVRKGSEWSLLYKDGAMIGINQQMKDVFGITDDQDLVNKIVMAYMSEGIADITFMGGTTMYIDAKGKVIEPEEKIKPFMKGKALNSGLPFRDGLANFAIAKTGEKKAKARWSYMNKKGKMVIDDLFDDASSFQEGVAKVRKTDGVDYYIDKRGRKVFA